MSGLNEGGRSTPLDIEEREDIRRLLDELTPLNHRIIAGRFLLGETDEEIAIHTGLERQAVRQRISRSLKILRRLAAEQGSSNGQITAPDLDFPVMSQNGPEVEI